MEIITKEKIAAEVITSLSGGQSPNQRKIDPRTVYEAIETIRNGFLEAWMQEFGDLDGEFVTQYQDVPVLCDGSTGQKYSILPTRLISFGEINGLRQVSPMKNQRMSFIKMLNGSVMTFALLEAGLLAGNTGYYIERVKIGTNKSTRIYYQNIPNDFDKVLIKQIASTYDFDEDEQLPIPAKYEQQLKDEVYRRVALQNNIPLDTKEDQNPDRQ